MSRSYKRNSIGGIACAKSDKEYKQKSHRKLRARHKEDITKNWDDPLLSDPRIAGDPWSSPKDGKRWFNPKEHPRMMRK